MKSKIARRASSRRGQDRQRVFRLRQVDLTVGDLTRIRQDLRRRGNLVAHTVYECPLCGERLVGERRCPDCHVFCRALGPGGPCPDCERPILLTELLGTDGSDTPDGKEGTP